MSSVLRFRANPTLGTKAGAYSGPQGATEIVKAFNTWAFKREQPSDVDLLHEVVGAAVMRGAPLSFVLYWGKGPRSRMGEPDRSCLDYLGKLAARVGEVHAPGALFHLVLTDTHARLNGHPEVQIQSYFDDVTRAAQSMSFGCSHLSDVVASAGPPTLSTEAPTAETLARLEKCAAKWYRGDAAADEAARQYFDLNMIEKRAIEVMFPSSIFVTFNDSTYRVLFPDRLPIFYMYSIRRGVAVKPWFMPDVDDRTVVPPQPAVDAAE